MHYKDFPSLPARNFGLVTSEPKKPPDGTCDARGPQNRAALDRCPSAQAQPFGISGVPAPVAAQSSLAPKRYVLCSGPPLAWKGPVLATLGGRYDVGRAGAGVRSARTADQSASPPLRLLSCARGRVGCRATCGHGAHPRRAVHDGPLTRPSRRWPKLGAPHPARRPPVRAVTLRGLDMGVHEVTNRRHPESVSAPGRARRHDATDRSSPRSATTTPVGRPPAAP